MSVKKSSKLSDNMKKTLETSTSLSGTRSASTPINFYAPEMKSASSCFDLSCLGSLTQDKMIIFGRGPIPKDCKRTLDFTSDITLTVNDKKTNMLGINNADLTFKSFIADPRDTAPTTSFVETEKLRKKTVLSASKVSKVKTRHSKKRRSSKLNVSLLPKLKITPKVCKSPNLLTKLRSARKKNRERRSIDQEKSELKKSLIAEREKKTAEKIKIQKEIEKNIIDEQIKETRKLTIFKASPIRAYSPIKLKKNNQLTVPESPKFVLRRRVHSCTR